MGKRWKFVKNDYLNCLKVLAKMKDIIVSTITFDQDVYTNVEQKTPAQAIKQANNLVFGGGDTNYSKALDAMINCMEKVEDKYKNYCNCFLFLSDGQGGYPEEGIKKINKLKEAGKKIICNTIAFSTEEDEDMMKMMKAVGGEHFNVSSEDGAKEVFKQILCI